MAAAEQSVRPTGEGIEFLSAELSRRIKQMIGVEPNDEEDVARKEAVNSTMPIRAYLKLEWLRFPQLVIEVVEPGGLGCFVP